MDGCGGRRRSGWGKTAGLDGNVKGGRGMGDIGERESERERVLRVVKRGKKNGGSVRPEDMGEFGR